MKLESERDVLPAESLEDAADRAYRLQRVSERLAEALTPQQVLDAVLTENTTYRDTTQSGWRIPTTIAPPRLLKFSLQLDF